jgi:thiamine-phosphate pyrophosphorylase
MSPTLSNASLKLKCKKSHRHKGRLLPTLILMTDEVRTPNPEALLQHLPRGAGVILRHYDDPARGQIAARLRTICRRRGLRILVGGDWRLAAKVDAHGLHLPTRLAAKGLEPGARLWIRQRKKLLTVAAHSARDLRRANAISATAAVLSPIFHTDSHPGRRSLGRLRCAAIAHSSKVAVIALGGVSEKTINAIYPTRCVGVAGIGFASKNK